MAKSSVRFSPSELLPSLSSFSQKIIALAELIGLEAKALELDHIAVRINNENDASLAHEAWAKEGVVISNAIINNRPIIVIELSKSLSLIHWQTHILELPYPAQGKQYDEGWEHVEFVVSGLNQLTMESFIEHVKSRFPLLAQRWESLDELGVSVKYSIPQGEGERLLNPTIAFKSQGLTIKLHPHSLKEVIESECED